MALLPVIRITSEICLLTATLSDKDNPSTDALLSDNSSNSQETFVEGWQVCFCWLVGLSTLHASARSPNLTIKTLISSEKHVMCCGSIKALVVRYRYGLVNT